MPSVTSLPGLVLSNLGPLTTTFTAAASCATQADQTVLAYSGMSNDIYMYLSCDKDVTYDGCFPSGSAFDEQASASIVTPGIGTQLYYSPGTACPSDWATVGLASRDAEGTLTSSGPAFALPTMTEGPFADIPLAQFLGYNPNNNQMLGALDPEETLVMCCPSSMEADIYGNCRGELPPLPLSTACPHMVVGSDIPELKMVNTTFSIFGTTVTGEQYSWGTNPVSIEPTITDLYPAMISSLTAIEYSPMIMMAHRASATPTPTTGTGTGTGSPAPSSTGDEDSASAAAALAPLWLSALGLAAGLAVVIAM